MKPALQDFFFGILLIIGVIIGLYFVSGKDCSTYIKDTKLCKTK